MPASTEPNFGIKHSWAVGESYKPDMDANLKKLGALLFCSVKNTTTTAQPGSPVEGDRYIVGASATGAWSGKDKQIAVFANGAWLFYTPGNGWLARDESASISTAGCFKTFDGTNWVNADLGIPAGKISDTHINAAAAIALSKLAALTASRAVVTDGSGALSAATATAAQVNALSGRTAGRVLFIDGSGLLSDSANALLTTSGNMTLTYSTTDSGGTGLTLNRTASTTANSTTTPLGLYVFFQSQVGSGVVDSGTRIGARYDVYAGSSHAGTASFSGFESRAFIDSSAPASAVVSAAYGFRSYVFNNKSGATITTGVAIYGDSTSTQTITTAYDFVGNNSSARNYLAGTLGVGSDNTYSQIWGASTSATRRAGVFRGAVSQSVPVLEVLDSSNNVLRAVTVSGKSQVDGTITATGTTGAQTINRPSGAVNFAAAATSLVVTCDQCTTSSYVVCSVATNDTTMKSVVAVPASGSFTIYPNAAPTAETRVFFEVIDVV